MMHHTMMHHRLYTDSTVAALSYTAVRDGQNHRKPQKMEHGLIRARTSTGKGVLVRAYLSIIAHVRSLLLLLLLSEEAADCSLRASVQNLLRARHFSQSALSDAACDSCHVRNDVRIRSGSLDGKRNAALSAT